MRIFFSESLAKFFHARLWTGLFHPTGISPSGPYGQFAKPVENNQFFDLLAEVSRPAHISALNRNQEYPVGASTILECNVQSSDGSNPSVSWRRDGRELPGNAMVDGPRLRLDNLELSDEGRYICQLSNGASDHINLIVSRKYLTVFYSNRHI